MSNLYEVQGQIEGQGELISANATALCQIIELLIARGSLDAAETVATLTELRDKYKKVRQKEAADWMQHFIDAADKT